jgi:hypothetical protein
MLVNIQIRSRIKCLARIGRSPPEIWPKCADHPGSPSDPGPARVVEIEPAIDTDESLHDYYRGTRLCMYYVCCSAKYRLSSFTLVLHEPYL